MHKIRMLWLDLTIAVKEAELTPEFSKHCEIAYASDPADLDGALARQPIDVLCFDFDYPDRVRLRFLRETKTAHPSLPIIMLTVQHSEALAIWAFRARVSDYLVKPVPKTDVERCVLALSRARSFSESQRPRLPTPHTNRIPDEVPNAPKSRASALGPAIHFVEKYFRSKIRGEEVAALCGLSPFRFSRAFKDAYGITFRDYLVDYRLREACRLLENPSATITDVAFAVGFNDASYFARMFKQRVGTVPSLLVGQSLAELAPKTLQ